MLCRQSKKLPAIPSSDYDSSNEGNLIYIRPVYDQSKIPMWGKAVSTQSNSALPIGLVTLAVLVTLILVGSAIAIWNNVASPEVKFAEAIIQEDES